MISAALALGMVTSLHCAFMCGPLAVVACRRGRDAALYLGARFAAYALAGALFGVVGSHALCILPVGVVQTATVVLVVAFAAVRGAMLLRAPRPAAPVTLRRRAPRRLAARLLGALPRGALTLGLATGLLPCAMLLPAWTLAMGAGDAAGGAATMVAFAAASAPGLIAPLAGSRLLRYRPSPRIEAMAWGLLAVWTVVRPFVMAGHVHHG